MLDPSNSADSRYQPTTFVTKTSLVKIYQRLRRDRGVIRGAIAVVDRLAFWAEVRGAIGAIAPRSQSSIADGFRPDFSSRSRSGRKRHKCRVFLISEEEQ